MVMVEKGHNARILLNRYIVFINIWAFCDLVEILQKEKCKSYLNVNELK